MFIQHFLDLSWPSDHSYGNPNIKQTPTSVFVYGIGWIPQSLIADEKIHPGLVNPQGLPVGVHTIF